MIMDRYDPVNLFDLVPKLMTDVEPELRQLDRLLEDDVMLQRVKADLARRPPNGIVNLTDFRSPVARKVGTGRHQLIDLPIDRIEPSPFQVRQEFEGIDELAAAMREHGFTSHLWVREQPGMQGRYQLVYGERRLRAARVPGITIISCAVMQYDDREMLEIGLTENLQRQDLKPLEEAEGFQRFIDEFGYSVRALADRIGKDKGYVENRLRLLRMPDDVQAMVTVRPDTLSAAREVARLKAAEARAPLIEGIVGSDLSLKTTHAIVEAALDHPERASAIVVERLTDQGARGGSNPPTALYSGDRMPRTLERDWSTMVAMVERWQARIPSLSPAGRSTLQDQINRLLVALEELAEQMR